MVQILEDPSRERFRNLIAGNFGESFGQGLGRGMNLSQAMAEEARKAAMEKQLASQKRAHDYGLLGRESDLKRALELEKIREKTSESKKLFDYFGLSDEEESPQIIPSDLSQETPSKEFSIDEKIASLKRKIPSQQRILGLSVNNPSAARSLESQRSVLQDQINRLEDRKFKEQQFSESNKQFGHKETKKFAENISEKSDQATQVLDAIKQGRKIAKANKTGFSPKNAIFSYLSSTKSPFASLFSSPESQTFLNIGKTLAGTGVKEIFNKPTEREFFWFDNILPNILKDAETNEKSFDYFEKIAKFNLERQKIFDEIVRENKGYRPIDIEEKVNNKMKDKTKELVKEGYELSPGKMVTVISPEGEEWEIDQSELNDLPEEWKIA